MGSRLVATMATSAIALTDLRAQAAAALAPETDTDPQVFADVVDAVTPPALLLVWGDPWLTTRTMGGHMVAAFEVLAIAGRLEPGPGVATLETLVSYVITRLRGDGYPWP